MNMSQVKVTLFRARERFKLEMLQMKGDLNYFVPENSGQMQEQVQAMMSDLKWMSDHLEYSGAEVDKRRFAYLKKNGVQVYGAVVTGPIRELEKLTKIPEFQHFYLNRVEIWNWD
ncbi:anti sigma factor C-terminal domain-containing protein [Paenibacillus sp. FSL K6-0108]|uniref:anti sigma factor C-terminal domain-containing protein n=1 Tax=Paenibacillus sp. FSL K6-0108 TaxID=2921417 RepID=UPI0032488B83